MNYEEARKIVTAPDYKTIRKKNAPKHPRDLSDEDRAQWGEESSWNDSGWGDGLSTKALEEMQLIRYIFHYFGCQPAPGERAKYIHHRK